MKTKLVELLLVLSPFILGYLITPHILGVVIGIFLIGIGFPTVNYYSRGI